MSILFIVSVLKGKDKFVEVTSVYIIINPAAGKDEAVEDKIKQVFSDSTLKLTLHVLEESEEAAEVARKAAERADLVAVYGGDGSVTEAAAGLIGSNTPIAIIPGGTANVLSKELGIPQETEKALELIRDGKYQVQKIDTGVVNGRPFLLRVNLGIMAEMITETDPELKDKIGQLAYGVATVKSVRAAEPIVYKLTIDGQTIEAKGVSLTITNSGSMGIGNLQMLPGINVSDGLLDVVLLKDAGLMSVIKAAGGSLLGLNTDVISHWTGKDIRITLPDEQTYLCDDCEDQTTELDIKIVPASLAVVVPIND